MDIQSLKINFVQEFLRLKNEQIIKSLVERLREEKKKLYEAELKPLTQKEFTKMIDQAEADAKQGRLTEVNSLKKDIDNWT